MVNYYVDSCIWLNLFKKETRNGVEYWRFARDFIDNSDNKLIISTIVLKELSFVLGKKFEIVKEFFNDYKELSIVKTRSVDYDFARFLERKHDFILSFYDFLHIAIAKRLNVCLVTRDNDLMRVARCYVKVVKPEELL